MEHAYGIVERIEQRGTTPRFFRKATNENEKQENKDAIKLTTWRNENTKCPIDIKRYLDTHIPGWDEVRRLIQLPMDNARDIVERIEQRDGARPRFFGKATNENEKQEKKDTKKLLAWSDEINKCPDEVKAYLDTQIPGWDNKIKNSFPPPSAMNHARDIVERIGQRGWARPRFITPKNENERQERKDAMKLADWHDKRIKCPDEVKAYLDIHIPGWGNKIRNSIPSTMNHARDIVERIEQRGGARPRFITPKNENEKQERKDAIKLAAWRDGKYKCFDEVGAYLDTHIPGWNNKIKNSIPPRCLVCSINVVDDTDTDIMPPAKRQKII